MTNLQALWDLLRARANQWVDRDTLDHVGGEDTGRRMRTIRKNVESSAQWTLEERRDKRGRLEWRLSPNTAVMSDDKRERFRWRCQTCSSHPGDFSKTQASIDPRWRLGRCAVCRKPTVFQREGAGR